MARASSVVETGQTVRPFAAAVRRLAFAGRSCGTCGSAEIRPSNSRNAADILLACFFLSPFRCRMCRERFYRFWRPSFLLPPDPPVAPLMLVPKRRDIFNIDSSVPRQIEPEPVSPLRPQPRLIPLEPTVPVRIESVAAPTVQEPVPASPAPALPSRAMGGPVLILESDLSIRKLLRRLLERRGYSTVEIARPESMASELRVREAGLLVIDISNTPSVDLETLSELTREHPALKILVLSADPVPAAKVPGRVLTLHKPFPLDSFVDCVDCLLGPSQVEPRT
jgi:CheY-like chemotaxis protein